MSSRAKVKLMTAAGLVLIGAAVIGLQLDRLGQRQLARIEAGDQPSQLPEVFSSDFLVPNLRRRQFTGSPVSLDQELAVGSNYRRYLASYQSDGLRINGLLTVPSGERPACGWPAIVFNHGFIPPQQYRTQQRYQAYVDALARSGYVVFKIDFRGHDQSEGVPTGAYFSSGYAIDAINAVRSLQQFEEVDPERIGMWGHSMSGNVTLKSMLVDDSIKAGVIWAGAVYSYQDLVDYRLNDASYDPDSDQAETNRRQASELLRVTGDIDLDSQFWQQAALTSYLDELEAPLQLHHGQDDPVVSVQYSRDLVEELEAVGARHQYFEYASSDHDLGEPAFATAMRRTIEFYDQHLKG